VVRFRRRDHCLIQAGNTAFRLSMGKALPTEKRVQAVEGIKVAADKLVKTIRREGRVFKVIPARRDAGLFCVATGARP
jgi:hypothetical protein